MKGQDATIISASLSEDELKKSIDQLVGSVKQGMQDATDIVTKKVDEINRQLGSIGNISDGGSKFTEKIKKDAQEVKGELDKMSVALQKSASVGSKGSSDIQNYANAIGKANIEEKKYTDEIQRQAKIIRESGQWKEEGRYLAPNGDVFYDKERSNVTKREKTQLLSLEEQIIQAEQRRNELEKQSALEAQQQAQAQQQVTQAASGTQKIYENIYEMQERSNREIRAGGVRNTNFQNYEDFRAALANTLGLQKQEIVLANEETDSYNRLSNTLKQLQSAYYNLSKAERESDNGKSLVASIHEVERAMQKIQANASRPVNIKSVLGLSENTLDDIAYKMQMLQKYRSGLNVDTQRNEINQVNQSYDSLKKKMDEVMNKSKEMQTMNAALTRSFNYMKNRLAFYFTVGASTAFVKQIIEIRSQYELTERSLSILIRSAEKGSHVFRQLSEMSLISPYTLIELSNAARQLTAYGVAAKDLVDTTRRLADVSAAVGAPVERIAYALGHVQSYGHLTSLQARQFANSGIPLVKELANRYTELEGRMVTTADVYDRMKKHQVEYADVMGVINSMTDEGGKFFDFQAKQAETLKVQLANLNLAWNNMLNQMGESSQGIITFTIKSLKSLFASWESINKAMYTVIAAIGMYKAQAITLAMLLGKQTASVYANALGLKYDTAATFQNILSKKNLSTANAGLLLSMNRTNVGLKTALINMKLLTAEQAQAIVSGNRFATSWRIIGFSVASASKAIWASIKMISSAIMSNVWLVAATAFADLVISLNSLGKATKEINEAIGKSAKEASESLEKFIETAKAAGTIDAAKSGSLSSVELEKTWTNIKEEIETSSSAGKEFISQLLEEEDLSIRVSKAFDIAEKIEAANLKMKDLTNQIKISEDVWHGWLGQGLESNILTFTDAVWGKTLGQSIDRAFGLGNEESTTAFQNIVEQDLKKLSKSIKEEFSKENIYDPTEIQEALTRIREQIIANSDKLKGAAADVFRFEFDKVMAANFKKGIDANASLWNKFFEELKKTASSKFSSLTTDIMDESHTWTKREKELFYKAFANVNKDFNGQFKETLIKMENELESKDFKARILFAFDVQQLSSFQQEFKNRVTQAFGKMFYQSNISVAPKADMDMYEYTQANIKEIEKLREQEAAYKRDNSLYSKSELENITARRQLLEDINRLFNQQTAKDKRGKQDIVLDTLKEEISLIDKLQSDYERLTKAGESAAEALTTVRGAYGGTLDLINTKLKLFGLSQIDLGIITGKNPQEQLKYFKELKKELEEKGLGNLDRMKAVEGVIEKLEVKVKEYNLEQVTKGLNDELSKLKEEYELGVEFDANPELGQVFADMLGINYEELKKLPKTFDEFITLAQERINKLLTDNKVDLEFNIKDNLNLGKFDYWVKSSGQTINSNLVKELKSYVATANKIRVDEAKKQIEEWNKLLEKYGEYEVKRTRIMEDAERERSIARKKNASQEILDAIDERERQEMSKLNFEQFQKSPDWIVATGDLAFLSNKAIDMLIQSILKYKKEAKNLDPAQIKKMNQALRNLYKAQRKDNPFKSIANAFEEAKDRAEPFKQKLAEVEEEYEKLDKKRNEAGIATDKENKKLESLAKQIETLKQKIKTASKVDVVELTKSISDMVGVVSQGIGAVSDLFKAFGDEETAEVLNGITGALDKAGQFAAIGAQIGGGWGAAIGAVAGLFTGLISGLGDILSGNRAITNQIEQSERAVKSLEIAYNNLERAIDKASGSDQISKRQEALQNKEMQLIELEKQLQLEQSRKSKYRDPDKILDLESQISDLKNEIADLGEEMTSTFLGISSVSDAVTSMVDAIVDSLRNGENAMDSFNGSIKDMIASMIKNVYSAKVIRPIFEGLWDKINTDIQARGEDIARNIEIVTQNIAWAESNRDNDDVEFFVNKYGEYLALTYDNYISMLENRADYMRGYLRISVDEYINALNSIKDNYEKELAKATSPSGTDIDRWAGLLESAEPQVESSIERLEGILAKYGLLNNEASTNLSNLQQGIQGITEETAGALEGYMNGVSQQVYLHSELLTQIKDTLMGWNLDAQLGVQGEMLLQLQQTYAIQMAIQNILQGWSNPSGQAVRVEMV